MSFAEKNISSSFPTLLDNFTEGILILNKDHEVIFTSNLLNSMVGFSQEELLEKSLEDLFPENKDELKSIFQAAQYTESIVFYTKLKRKNHKFFVARIRIVKNTDKNSEEYFFLYIKDNTPYQRIRRDLLRKTLTVEQLSKSRKIRDGKLDLAIYEIVEMASRAMNTQRVNAWVFNEDHS
ncbi:MAG: PAS domain-containing protein, partial [Bacteroidia bacterium]